MQQRRSRLALVGLLTLALCATVGLTAGGTAEAKKGKKGGGTVNVTVGGTKAVPAATTGPPFRYGILSSTAAVGKKFKGRRIDDVNVTVQLNASGVGSELDALFGILTAPNGNSVYLFEDLFGTVAGPLTFDDESPLSVNQSDPADFQDPDFLNPPYIGRVEPFFGEELSSMDGGPARGAWTLKIRNGDPNPAHLYNLVQWKLEVKTRAPYVQK